MTPHRSINIYFTDFWPDFSYEDNFIVSALKNRYKITLDAKNPDYLFYSAFGSEHSRYRDAIKIYFTGENDVPDFNHCDYGIGSPRLQFDDRYFRFPFYALCDGYDENIVGTNKYSSLQSSDAQRKFCNFVYSNNQKADPMRMEFFRRLSQYKKVDSGGRWLNNIGGPVADKMDFIKDYKFTIAFENSSLSGYTTEKILDPMRVNSMPIYWGNPDAGMDFNAASFINVHDYESIDQVVEEIIFLDTNDEAYLDKLARPWINPGQYVDFNKGLSLFLNHIVELPLDKAKRTSNYGYNYHYKKIQYFAGRLYNHKLWRPILKRILR